MAHRTAGHRSPTGYELVRRAVAGLRRMHGARPSGKTALVTAPLVAICSRLHAVETATDQLAVAAKVEGQTGTAADRRRLAGRVRAAEAAAFRARRDRALLLVGYAAALRRSELVALDAGDLVDTEHGLQVFIARSKTDQTALGDFVGIAHGHPPTSCTVSCPIRAWGDWRDALTNELARLGEQLHPEAPAFRPLTRHGTLGTPGQPDPHARLTGQSVALIVKAAVALLDATLFFASFTIRGFAVWVYVAVGAALNVLYLASVSRAATDTPKPRLYFYVLSAVAFVLWSIATNDTVATAANLSGSTDSGQQAFVLVLAAFAMPMFDTLLSSTMAPS